jgi:hypothetical protein
LLGLRAASRAAFLLLRLRRTRVIIETVPFTLAHAAAALPFLRTRLIPSALVIGCFAPDFEDFIRFAPRGAFGHTLAGVFLLDLPLALAALWIFHTYAKEPLWAWLPKSVRQRVKLGPCRFSLQGRGQVALVLASILIGVATHILWDSLTHSYYWPYRHWRFLSYEVQLPFAGPMQYYKVFQIGSSVLGMLVVLVWFVLWCRAAVPDHSPEAERPRGNETAVLLLVLSVALIGAVVRAFAGVGVPAGRHRAVMFLAEAVITGISIFWIEVVAYGFVRARSRVFVRAG